MVLTQIIANYQFKTNFTIKSGYLISQLIDCMDKTTKQQIPITHAHKHIEVFTERRKTHNGQKTYEARVRFRIWVRVRVRVRVQDSAIF